jgi:CMP-N,N'-diacetyllegionaminic acid synthase
MKPLIVIPARGGSKGVPGKNIKMLHNKPLIQYTLEAAQQVFDKKLICVSTDDENIKSTAEKLGQPVPFLRPEHLATDTSGSYEVLLHAIEFYEKTHHYLPDTLILLQVTSPFRNSFHIQEALKLYDENCEMVVSVKESAANPYYTLREENENGWLVKSKEGNFTRRQDCPKVYELNGAIYIINVKTLKQKALGEFTKVRKYLMDEKSSHDIDTPFDWMIAEKLFEMKNIE